MYIHKYASVLRELIFMFLLKSDMGFKPRNGSGNNYTNAPDEIQYTTHLIRLISEEFPDMRGKSD